jgi:hypothetical protein
VREYKERIYQVKTNNNMRTKLSNLLKPALLIGAVMCCFLFSSCGKATDERTEKAIQWVNTHPKPIIITSVTLNGITMNYRCLFKDSTGCVYYAGEVRGFQPDTIK